MSVLLLIWRVKYEIRGAKCKRLSCKCLAVKVVPGEERLALQLGSDSGPF